MKPGIAFIASFFQVTSVACLSVLATAVGSISGGGGGGSGFLALPQFPRLRIIMFICIFTILFTVFVLVLNISHMNAFLPFEVGKMVSLKISCLKIDFKSKSFSFQQTLVYLFLTVAFVISSVLLYRVHNQTLDPSKPSSVRTKNYLLTASVRKMSKITTHITDEREG